MNEFKHVGMYAVYVSIAFWGALKTLAIIHKIKKNKKNMAYSKMALDWNLELKSWTALTNLKLIHDTMKN